jgi:tetratricopeptide (TPR) repeat protein
MSILRGSVSAGLAVLLTTTAFTYGAQGAWSAATISEDLYKHLEAGYLQVQKGSYDGAVKNFCDAVRTDRDSVTARRYLAYALVKAGAPELAVEQLSLITKMTSPSAYDSYLYGEAYYTAGQYKLSAEAYQKTLNLVPNFDAARGGLIKSLTLGGEFELAANECLNGLKQANDKVAKKYYQTMLACVQEIRSAPQPAAATTYYRQGPASPVTPLVRNQMDMSAE